MKKNILLKAMMLTVMLLTLASCGRTVDMTDVVVVPEPLFVNKRSGSFTLTGSPEIYLMGLGQNSPTAKYITKSLRYAHIRPQFVGTPVSGCITFGLNDTLNPELGDEGYLLEVRNDGISITANTEAGLFYGYQTFLQLLPADMNEVPYRHIGIPECTILDNPRFAWRGAHLDVSTHFFSTKFIKEYIDIMAQLKLNKLQLLLSNDYAYRLESEHFPLLNEVASFRADRNGVAWDSIEPASPSERCTYGGYYTSRQIADLVAYAADRHVEIIPELSLPGGVTAMLAAYPEWSCHPDSTNLVPVGPFWPHNSVLCMGADSLMSTVFTLLDEVMAMFPTRYVNLGLDAAATDNWESCPKCQSAMRQHHLRSESQLQTHFVSEIETYLADRGKVLIGRNFETTSVGPESILQCQSSVKDCQQFAYRGNFVVLSPDEYSFDAYQADYRYHPQSAPRLVTLQRVYNHDLVPQGTNTHVVSHILGGQCSLPTERITTPSQVEFMLLPRLCAMAENLWTQPDNRNWRRFRRNVRLCKNRFAAHGYTFCEGSFKPVFRTYDAGAGQYDVALETEVPNTYIFYTLDGSDPTEQSPIYLGPIRLASGTHIKTLTVYDGQQREGVYEFVIGK